MAITVSLSLYMCVYVYLCVSVLSNTLNLPMNNAHCLPYYSYFPWLLHDVDNSQNIDCFIFVVNFSYLIDNCHF